MKSPIFKLTGMIIGISLMVLAIAWSHDLESGVIVLFFGGVLVFFGASKIGEVDEAHKKRI